MTGYLQRAYAAALDELGAPFLLARSGGWLLERPLPAGAGSDLRGPYPLFCCADWAGLGADLAAVRGPVAAVLVSDPFGAYDETLLRACFPDLMTPYKAHYVIDLRRGEGQLPAHHARNVRRARAAVEVERLADPGAHLETWVALYATLMQRHAIDGVAAFSRASLAAQLAVPGLVMYRAVAGGETVGMVLWYVQGEVAYYHLAAYSAAGYAARASYALFDAARRDFAASLSWLSLGAGAGVHGVRGDGLERFKAGWATGTRQSFLCGRIFDREGYRALASARGATGTFFPLYRAPEVERT